MQMVSSVKRAMDILMLFNGSDAGLTLKDISTRIDLHKSSILRTLATLTSTGIVEKDPRTGSYRLGLLVLELAGSVLDRYDFREQARPHLEELAEKTGEIIHLFNEIFCLRQPYVHLYTSHVCLFLIFSLFS